MRCQTVFSEDPTEITEEEAQTFCQAHCSMYLSNLLHRLMEDCPIPPDQLVSSFLMSMLAMMMMCRRGM